MGKSVIEIEDDSNSDTGTSLQSQTQSPLHTEAFIDEGEEINETKCDDGFELVAPLSLLNNSGNECTLLVQVGTKDATTLDFHGASGAIGRFETGENGGAS